MRKINISMTAQAVSSLRVLSSLQLIAQRLKMSKKILKIKQKKIFCPSENYSYELEYGTLDIEVQ